MFSCRVHDLISYLIILNTCMLSTEDSSALCGGVVYWGKQCIGLHFFDSINISFVHVF